MIIFLIGTGALAKAMIDTLSFADLAEVELYVYSRSFKDSAWLATIGNTRSRVSGNRQKYVPHQIDWDSESFLADELNKHKPSLVIHAASLQSMWTLKQDNKWTTLVKSTGYGTTLPLQCKLALKVGRSIANAGVHPQLINCCYPDAVNYVLKKCGLDVLCGIGNIGIIEQLLLPREFLMLANHFHVQELIQPPRARMQLPKLWIDKKPLEQPRNIFDNIVITNDPSLNSITALTCLNLLKTLINKTENVLHLPGPSGEIGGYPVFFKNGEIDHIGTKLMDHKAEQQWNTQIMENEGLIFGEDRIRFSPQTAEKISQYSKSLAKGFSFSDIDAYIDEFIALRTQLSSP